MCCFLLFTQNIALVLAFDIDKEHHQNSRYLCLKSTEQLLMTRKWLIADKRSTCIFRRTGVCLSVGAGTNMVPGASAKQTKT